MLCKDVRDDIWVGGEGRQKTRKGFLVKVGRNTHRDVHTHTETHTQTYISPELLNMPVNQENYTYSRCCRTKAWNPPIMPKVLPTHSLKWNISPRNFPQLKVAASSKFMSLPRTVHIQSLMNKNKQNPSSFVSSQGNPPPKLPLGLLKAFFANIPQYYFSLPSSAFFTSTPVLPKALSNKLPADLFSPRNLFPGNPT